MPATSHSAFSPPTTPRDVDETTLLLEFVHDRNVHCPRCDYNLRNLTQPVCPECHEELRLSIGLGRPQFHWLIVTLAPGIFSGIAAFFLTCMLVMVSISPTGGAPWQVYVIDGFGWLSALATLLLFRRRYQFFKQPNAVQISWAGGAWFVHVAFFVVM